MSLHLLVSHEDPNHVDQPQSILTRHKFNSYTDRFYCAREDFILLGKRADPEIIDDRHALAHGAT